jgi:hypothetical protein
MTKNKNAYVRMRELLEILHVHVKAAILDDMHEHNDQMYLHKNKF